MPATKLPATWPAIHGGLFLVALALVPVFLPPLRWPWYLLIPLAAYAAVAISIPALRRTIPLPRAGSLMVKPALAAVSLSGITVVTLFVFQSYAQPDLTALAGNLPSTLFGSVLLAGICFCLGNAVLEELIFRGVLYEAFASEWGATVAICLTAAFFGLCHTEGYPPGLWGAILASLYGAAIGILRWWTGGLLLPVTCHATADATIFVMVIQGGY